MLLKKSRKMEWLDLSFTCLVVHRHLNYFIKMWKARIKFLHWAMSKLFLTPFFNSYQKQYAASRIWSSKLYFFNIQQFQGKHDAHFPKLILTSKMSSAGWNINSFTICVHVSSFGANSSNKTVIFHCSPVYSSLR